MTLEHVIQNQIRLALSQHNCIVFRANVGKVRMANGRWFETGLPKGHPDLYGFRFKDKQVFYIECKNERGKPRPEQITFHKRMQALGVIHGIARSADDAIKIVEKGLIGYGY